MAGKSGPEATDKIKVGRADLTGLREGLPVRHVSQNQSAARRNETQAPLTKGALQPRPTFRFGERFRDEETKSNEEPLVDDFVTPRFAAVLSLDFQPDEVAQHRAGGFVPRTAQRRKPLPQHIIALKKGLGHGP
jgi:hypothetical protein